MSGARPGDHVALIGMMGSGKTTVGAALGRLLGRPVLDSDDLVEKRSGRTVADIFAGSGSEAFRRLESDVLAEVLGSSTPSVVSVGGGAVLDPANRSRLASAGQVVWLRARPETLAARVGDGSGRPLLEGDPGGTLDRLGRERRRLYEELAGAVVDVDDLDPGEAVEKVRRCLVRRVTVPLGERSYDVLVGPGARSGLRSLVPGDARRAVVVSQEGIDVDLDTGLETTRVDIGRGEQAKSFTTVEMLCRSFVVAGLTRGDVVVAVGGGVVTDVAGFAASCYHRGVPVVHVATSLLAQIDAAIGGKTGVNLPEGKNLAGAFWQPAGVICDTDTLASLPEREWRSGLGEMAKYAFLGVDDLHRLPLSEQVARCVEAKAAVVGRDEREGGARMLLNYGHTLAHALEAIDLEGAGTDGGARVDLRHGEAVAIGLVFAARLAVLLGRVDESRLARHEEVVRSYGLPDDLPAGLDPEMLLRLMARDKKATASGLTFVLDGPSGLEVVHDVPPAAVLEALRGGRPGSDRVREPSSAASGSARVGGPRP